MRLISDSVNDWDGIIKYSQSLLKYMFCNIHFKIALGVIG